MIQLIKVMLLFSLRAHAELYPEGNFSSFSQARQGMIQNLKDFENIVSAENYKKLLSSIELMKDSYFKMDRRALSIEELYEYQFELRFGNFYLKQTLVELEKLGRLSKKSRQGVEFSATILNDLDQPYYRTPQKVLPIEGVKGSNWPLRRWQKDPDFFNYTFDGDDVLYRGLRFKSGDVILNHPVEKPTGIFTAVAEERSLYSHGSIFVVLNTPKGKLPVVVDEHERGVRAVPLHHYLGPKVIGYGEIFRMKNRSLDFNEKIDLAIKELLSVEHPYDLTGSDDRHALSCVELISYVLELMGNRPIPKQNRVLDKIYLNIQRLGKMENQVFQMPNDVLLDSRFEYVGYIDNTQTLEIQVANELMLDWFTEKMTNKVVKLKKDLSRYFGEVAIDQMRNKRSLFGGFLLGVTGFNRGNFPVGDPSLLTAVNAIDNSFAKAMGRCIAVEKGQKPTACFQGLNSFNLKNRGSFIFSINELKTNAHLRQVSGNELKEFDKMFE